MSEVNCAGGGARHVGDDPVASARPSCLGARVERRSLQLVPVGIELRRMLGSVATSILNDLGETGMEIQAIPVTELCQLGCCLPGCQPFGEN